MTTKKKTGILTQSAPPPDKKFHIYEWDDYSKSFKPNELFTTDSLAEMLIGRCRELDTQHVKWEIRDEAGLEVMSCAALEKLRLRDEP